MNIKIVSIVESATKSNIVALRTEPPVTKTIHEALKKILSRSTFGSVGLEGDFLTVTPTQLDRGQKDIEFLSEHLAEAEKTVQEDEKKAKDARDGFLQDLSRKLGLPLA